MESTTMAETTQLEDSTVVNASNGVHKEAAAAAIAAAVVLSPEQQQRPRKLSFDDTDMELTKLKLGAAVRRFPLPLVVAGATACTLVSLLVRYLLPFNAGSFKAALETVQRWRQSVAERVVLDYNRGYAALKTTMKDTYDNGAQVVRDPSLVTFAILFAITVSWFTYYVVYLDSSIPGVNPPTPFSASKKRNFSDKERRFHLGYITALLSGLTVFMIIVLVD